MRIRVTGSKAHRVWKCPASAVLPQVDRGDLHAPARGRGKQIHAYLQRASDVGIEHAMGELEDDGIYALLRAIDLTALPTQVSAEVAFAWNWDAMTGRRLHGVTDRQYQIADPPIDWSCEIPLTLDLVGAQRRQNAEFEPTWIRGYVGDYKSGHTKYPAPDQFGQTLLGAACLRSVAGCDEVVVELITIHDDGTHHSVRRTVDEWELDVFQRELKAAMELTYHWEAEYAAGRSVAAHEGTWCRDCEAYKACPAKVALVRSLPVELMSIGIRPGSGGELEVQSGALTVSRAAEAWMALERIKDVIKRAQTEIIGFASIEEIPLPDGRVIGRTVTERREVSGQLAAELIEKRYGREERDRRVQVTCTLDAIRQAVVANIKPGQRIDTKKGDGVLNLVLADLERSGGLTVKTTEKIAPHVPKKKR